MKTLQGLKKQIRNTEDLGAVVKTMKVLAAVNIRQFERAVESLVDYRNTIERGFQIVLRNRPDILTGVRESAGRRIGAVVFGSDQGMCGQFNEQLADFAARRLGDSDERRILALGGRIAPRLEDRELEVQSNLPLTGSLSAIVPLLHEVVIRIETWRARGEVDRVLLFNNEPTSGSSYRPRALQLVPLDAGWLRSLRDEAWPSRCFPTYTMQWRGLFAFLVRQFFFVGLYRAMVESLASENAARLAAMQVAEKNVQERLDEIRAQFNHQRQSSITAELLDIVSGFEALVSSD
jgi:F-type H+-transporting ATPase subunit gamma